jgi:hypothetical protein
MSVWARPRGAGLWWSALGSSTLGLLPAKGLHVVHPGVPAKQVDMCLPGDVVARVSCGVWLQAG